MCLETNIDGVDVCYGRRQRECVPWDREGVVLGLAERISSSCCWNRARHRLGEIRRGFQGSRRI